ncbi:MAG: lysophospholipid acyltransferase family protein [Bacteroidetes bacterium]|nr:lysophospholipid acyltransferase family protein [Bacteroidota bacterium]
MQIFYFIWAVWGMLVVIHSLIIVTPIYAIIFLVGSKNSGAIAHQLSRIWAAYLMFLFGIRIKVHGKENLSKGQTYIFVSNHNSQLDIPVCALTTQHFFKFLAKEELTKIPLLGYIIKNLYITVSRGSVRDRVKSLDKMKEALAAGICVWIFPEGTRNTTAFSIAPFQEGAFHLASKTGVPVAVCTIVSTRKILPTGGGFRFKPGRIDCYWASPFFVAKEDDLKTVSARVSDEMRQEFEGKKRG